MSTTMLQSADIRCGDCAGTLFDALRAVPGVDTVSIDIRDQSVAVIHAAPADGRSIQEAVRQAGYRIDAVDRVTRRSPATITPSKSPAPVPAPT